MLSPFENKQAHTCILWYTHLLSHTNASLHCNANLHTNNLQTQNDIFRQEKSLSHTHLRTYTNISIYTHNLFIGKKSLSLSDVVNDLSTRYASMRRREVLTRVRDLLLSDYHNTMLAAGDGMYTLMI